MRPGKLMNLLNDDFFFLFFALWQENDYTVHRIIQNRNLSIPSVDQWKQDTILYGIK